MSHHNVVDEAIEHAAAAQERFDQANRVWQAAIAAYNDAYGAAEQRHMVVDEFGLPTGETAPFDRIDRANLEPLQFAERDAWSRRQAAKGSLEQATADLNEYRFA